MTDSEFMPPEYTCQLCGKRNKGNEGCGCAMTDAKPDPDGIRAAAEEITFSKHDSLDDFRHLVEVVLRREVEREREKKLLTMCPKCKLVFNARYDWKGGK